MNSNLQRSEPRSGARPSSVATTSPDTDIYETKESVVLVADVPGVSQNDVEITLERDILTVVAKITHQVPAGYALAAEERHIADFRRTFSLGDGLERDGITAQVKDGVLTVTLPKARTARPRKIEVRSS